MCFVHADISISLLSVCCVHRTHRHNEMVDIAPAAPCIAPLGKSKLPDVERKIEASATAAGSAAGGAAGGTAPPKSPRGPSSSSALAFGSLPDGDLHLLVDVKQTMFLIGDRSEVYFSLYSARDQVFITYV